MTLLERVWYFLRHLLICVDEHSLHSPLVYDLFTKVIKKSAKFIPDETAEKARNGLKADHRRITVTDFGSGAGRPPERKISDIARKSLAPPRRSGLLTGLVKHFESKGIVELGTSLGTNTLYLSALPGVVVNTFEGCPETAKIASGIFEREGRTNVRVHVGDIGKTLPPFIRKEKPDMVYFDANHRYLPTIEYFEICLDRAHDKSVFIFDDIHLSRGMDKAWNEIKKNTQVTLSIDCFHFGLLLFDPMLAKRDYVLSF